MPPETKPESNPETKPESQSSPGIVFLTFDDGPNIGTSNIVRVLHNASIRGTFFMVGRYATSYKGNLLTDPELFNIFHEVAEVGNHSHTHLDFPGMTLSQASAHLYRGDNSAFVTADFERAEKELSSFGLDKTLARFPGANTWRVGDIKQSVRTTAEEADSIAAKKYKIFGWDEEWKQPRRPDQITDMISRMLTRGLTKKPGKFVLLSHDRMFETTAWASHLEELVNLLKKKGCSFEVLSKY